MEYRDSQQAFEQAIAEGRFSLDHESAQYVGDYMYMGTKDGVDLFKNRNTREYLA